MVLQAFVWIEYHVQLDLFTTKSTKVTKVWTIKTPNFVLFVSFVVKTLQH